MIFRRQFRYNMIFDLSLNGALTFGLIELATMHVFTSAGYMKQLFGFQSG